MTKWDSVRRALAKMKLRSGTRVGEDFGEIPRASSELKEGSELGVTRRSVISVGKNVETFSN
jgi:hypothetical protein